MNGLLEDLKKYIAPGTDRLAFLQKYLSDRGVSTSVINVQDKKHLFVNFPASSFNPKFRIKTLISHYDIVPESPGANDNSSANMSLASFAVKINERAKKGQVSNIRIFFTDGEELGENGVSDQGAFGLAEFLKKAGISDSDVFVFDSTGRGTVPVLAEAGLSSVKVNAAGGSSVFVKKFASLFERTRSILSRVSPEKWITLPVPYSDNAGFLASGIPAVALTMLPEEESSLYYKELLKDKNLSRAVMNAALESGADFKFKYQEKMPVTWRLFHTEYDNFLSLTPESFEVMEKILDELLVLYM